MSTLVTILHVVVCLFLMLTVLLQQGKGGGMGGAFGGSNAGSVFGGAGASSFLQRLTAVAASVFMLTSMVLAFIASRDAGDSLEKYSNSEAAKRKRAREAERRAFETTDGGVTPDVVGDAGVGTSTGAVDLGTVEPTGATGAGATGAEVPAEIPAAGSAAPTVPPTTPPTTPPATGTATPPAAGSAATVPPIVATPPGAAPAAGTAKPPAAPVDPAAGTADKPAPAAPAAPAPTTP